MKQKTSLFLLCFALMTLLVSCTSSNKGKQTEVTNPESSATTYPFFSNEKLTNLYALTDMSDMIFYDLPISINQDDPKSAKSTVLYVSPAPVVINPACKPMGRISWMYNGKIFKEADFYADTGCYFFVFMENNKPVAANVMSEGGVDFYKQIISEVEKRQK